MRNIGKFTIPKLFVGTIIIALLVIVYASCTFEVDDISIDTDELSNFNTNWYYTNQGNRVFIPTTPTSVKVPNKEKLIIHKQLPTHLTQDEVLCVKTNHQSLEAYIDDTLVYGHGLNNKASFGKQFGTIWNFIEIPKESAGQLVTLQLDKPYNQSKELISDIKIGRKSAAIFFMLKKNYHLLFSFFFTFQLGVLFIVYSWILKNRHVDFNRKSFLYVGIFSLLSAIWMITDANILQLFTGNIIVIYFLSFFSFMLLPIPFLLYLKENTKHGKKLLDYLCLLFIASFLINIGLYICNVLDLIQSVVMTHILLIITLILIFYICFKEALTYKNKDMREIIWGLLSLFILAVMAITNFYVKISTDNSLFFQYGVGIFILLLAINTIKKSIALLNKRTEAEIYKELAYTDTMTKLSNRAAFEKEMTHLEENIQNYQSIGCIVIDLNYLKKANDTYGHKEGDKLIVGLADCLRAACQHRVPCYRIGGDEFAIILTNKSEAEIQQILNQIEEKVANQNKSNFIPIDYAWGYTIEIIKTSKEVSVYTIFNEADTNMYTQKMSMRKGRK
ncbi:GGDEF domain-containing protein [Bacillus massiliigorillae]|uniref:GGDEF domain-containing protein n=1 Tax=Bacillus massiliigorillae TaxID=1243664 RepID=UPI00039A080A|nr:GGDEF domain-containing protein [Bacillus massiliigorillae]